MSTSTPQVLPEAPTGDKLRRLGLTSAAALVVANMIGTGVFTTSGYTLEGLGSRELVLAAWAVAGLVALSGALSYGALARRLPQSGGEYYFLHHLIHPLAGFLAGWVSLLAGFTAPTAAAALLLQAYLVPGAEGVSVNLIGTAAIVVAALMHGIRLKHGVVLQNVAVGLKLILISAFIVIGAVTVPGIPRPEEAAGSQFAIGAFAVSLVWISFSYSGWNAVVYIAGEVRSPKRNLHRSILLATLLVTALYLALNAVFVYSSPIADLAGRPEIGAIAADALGGPALRRATSILVALALFTTISAMVMIGPRVYARMAEDRLFPKLFAHRGDVPTLAIALQAGLAIVVVWSSGLRQLLGYIGFTLGLSAAATVGSLFVLRLREGRERVPVPGFPVVPALFVLATLGAAGFMIVEEPREAGVGLGTVLAGVPVYAAFRWWGRRPSHV